MILTIVLFTVGGHGERWICQSIEAPFYGLKVNHLIAAAAVAFDITANYISFFTLQTIPFAIKSLSFAVFVCSKSSFVVTFSITVYLKGIQVYFC